MVALQEIPGTQFVQTPSLKRQYTDREEEERTRGGVERVCISNIHNRIIAHFWRAARKTAQISSEFCPWHMILMSMGDLGNGTKNLNIQIFGISSVFEVFLKEFGVRTWGVIFDELPGSGGILYPKGPNLKKNISLEIFYLA